MSSQFFPRFLFRTSGRHKDRKSRTSVLTYKESKRFKRAMYRVMLLSFMYGMDSFSGPMTEEDRPPETSALCRSRQWEFLNRFDSDNLNQIQTVSYFLHRMVNWVFSASSDGDILAMINICAPSFSYRRLNTRLTCIR